MQDRISAARLKLNEKNTFGVWELSFVGHVVNVQGLTPLQLNVDVLYWIVHSYGPFWDLLDFMQNLSVT